MYMVTSMRQDICLNCDAVIIPFTRKGGLKVKLPRECEAVVEAAMAAKSFDGKCGEVHSVSACLEGRLVQIVLAGLGDPMENTAREQLQAFAKAMASCKSEKAESVIVLMDNADGMSAYPDRLRKLCEVPYLTGYRFDVYKTSAPEKGLESVTFITSMEGFEALMKEAEICGESAGVARDLVNHPSVYMTPEQLAKEAEKIGGECGIEVEVFTKPQIAEMKMDSFLAVGRGAVDEPRLIVMRYKGGPADQPATALIGKGVMFDSGGYSLKSKMATMHGDMAGGAAVIGAIRAIALAGLKINVTAIVAACKNMISGDAYVPGDILNSMNGKTIEMLNADAEGRLTLVDAITYAIRREGAERLIDIATLTGAASGAVGRFTSPVIASDDALYDTVWEASKVSCEKVWRLDADEELFAALKSSVADIKNTNPGSPLGGGTITAGLFIKAFTEEKPWVHIDMAPVSWNAENTPLSCKGGTGYGVSLLYETVKKLQ